VAERHFGYFEKGADNEETRIEQKAKKNGREDLAAEIPVQQAHFKEL
jgi:hypothetical protein